MVKEIRSVAVEKGAIIPVNPRDLTYKDLKKVITSALFFKEKFSPTGEFQKLKARLVAGGHMQDRSVFEQSDISSPTINTSSVLLLASIAAKERRKVWTMDVGTAYLNAKIPDNAPKQLMRLN
jgi:hypothetical protein